MKLHNYSASSKAKYLKGLKTAVKKLKISKAAQIILLRIGKECWASWADSNKALQQSVNSLAKANRTLRKRLEQRGPYEYLDPFKDIDRKK